MELGRLTSKFLYPIRPRTHGVCLPIIPAFAFAQSQFLGLVGCGLAIGGFAQA